MYRIRQLVISTASILLIVAAFSPSQVSAYPTVNSGSALPNQPTGSSNQALMQNFTAEQTSPPENAAANEWGGADPSRAKAQDGAGSAGGAKSMDPAGEVSKYVARLGGDVENVHQSFPGGKASTSQSISLFDGAPYYTNIATTLGGGSSQSSTSHHINSGWNQPTVLSGSGIQAPFPETGSSTTTLPDLTDNDGDKQPGGAITSATSAQGGGSLSGGGGSWTQEVSKGLSNFIGKGLPGFGRESASHDAMARGAAAAKQGQMGACPGQGSGAGKANQNAEKQSGADNLAAMERFHAAAAIEFCRSYLKNFTVEGGNKWNRVRNQLFIPMAFLLLLPGAVLCQVKSIVSQGFAVLGEMSPFEGIFRSIVATFMIPATYLVVNYGIDVGNALTKSISDSYRNCFGTDMYEDAFCGHIRAFPIRLPEENPGMIENVHALMFNYFGSTPVARFEGQTLAIKYEDPCSLLYIVPPDRANELVPYMVNEMRMAFNQINAAFTCAWTILCAVQEAYLYYLWFVGPVMAALWVFPAKQLRDAFPSWIEGVICICFWNLFWSTTIMLMACFRGVDDTGTVIFTALNFLAVGSVKFAFDFSGLVKEAGTQAVRVGEKAAQAAVAADKKAKGGGGGGGGGGGDKEKGGGSKDKEKGSGADGQPKPQEDGTSDSSTITGTGTGLGTDGSAGGKPAALSASAAPIISPSPNNVSAPVAEKASAKDGINGPPLETQDSKALADAREKAAAEKTLEDAKANATLAAKEKAEADATRGLGPDGKPLDKPFGGSLALGGDGQFRGLGGPGSIDLPPGTLNIDSGSPTLESLGIPASAAFVSTTLPAAAVSGDVPGGSNLTEAGGFNNSGEAARALMVAAGLMTPDGRSLMDGGAGSAGGTPQQQEEARARAAAQQNEVMQMARSIAEGDQQSALARAASNGHEQHVQALVAAQAQMMARIAAGESGIAAAYGTAGAYGAGGASGIAGMPGAPGMGGYSADGTTTPASYYQQSGADSGTVSGISAAGFTTSQPDQGLFSVSSSTYGVDTSSIGSGAGFTVGGSSIVVNQDNVTNTNVDLSSSSVLSQSSSLLGDSGTVVSSYGGTVDGASVGVDSSSIVNGTSFTSAYYSGDSSTIQIGGSGVENFNTNATSYDSSYSTNNTVNQSDNAYYAQSNDTLTNYNSSMVQGIDQYNNGVAPLGSEVQYQSNIDLGGNSVVSNYNSYDQSNVYAQTSPAQYSQDVTQTTAYQQAQDIANQQAYTQAYSSMTEQTYAMQQAQIMQQTTALEQQAQVQQQQMQYEAQQYARIQSEQQATQQMAQDVRAAQTNAEQQYYTSISQGQQPDAISQAAMGIAGSLVPQADQQVYLQQNSYQTQQQIQQDGSTSYGGNPGTQQFSEYSMQGGTTPGSTSSTSSSSIIGGAAGMIAGQAGITPGGARPSSSMPLDRRQLADKLNRPGASRAGGGGMNAGGRRGTSPSAPGRGPAQRTGGNGASRGISRTNAGAPTSKPQTNASPDWTGNLATGNILRRSRNIAKQSASEQEEDLKKLEKMQGIQRDSHAKEAPPEPPSGEWTI